MVKETFKLFHTLKTVFFAIIVVYFLAMIGITPLDVSDFFGSKISSAVVGMSTSVSENSFSKLAIQLEQKEKTLAAREARVEKKEQELTNGFGYGGVIYFLAGGIVILFFLILTNFYLDYRRRKREN